jgi:predicted XRE-type DNA-binding protein
VRETGRAYKVDLPDGAREMFSEMRLMTRQNGFAIDQNIRSQNAVIHLLHVS